MSEENERVGRGEPVPADPGRAQLVADTEALDERYGGRAVLRGGLGAAAIRPRPSSTVEERLDDGPVPVDPPEPPQTLYATVLSARDADRRPIVPAWARNRGEAQALAAWLARYGLHVTLYHLTRLPKYALKLALRAPVGLLVALVGVWAWVADREAAPLRREAVTRTSTEDYLKLEKVRAAKVRTRGLAVLVMAAPLLVLVLAWLVARRWGVPDGEPARDVVPWFIEWPLWAVLVGVLGKLGTPTDRRVTDVATVNAAAPPRLTAEVVTRALRSLGISAMNAKNAEITYPAPITRDGPGWRADVDLPFGVTPQDVMEKRRELASGLRRPLGCVWPEPSRDDHAGRLVLWVGDRDLAKTKPERWPLVQRGRTDLFAPVPFGVDQRGRAVTVTLMFASMVVGSIPRMGKTFAVRLLLLAAALDVRAELHLFELKGTGDFGALQPVAHAYRAGDDEEDIEYAVADMRAVHAEMRRRTKVIRELPRTLCPENKVTPELADRRPLGLWPIVVTADECQRWFEHKRHGEELTGIAEDLVRRGPAVGILPIFATQRPDAKSLPTGISGNAILRFCLKVMGHTENDMVLGTSAHKNGIRATIFSRKDLGIGYLSGEGDDPQITRTYYVDNVAAEAVVARARAAREAAGTLSGHALGEQPEAPLTPAASLLDDLRVVFATAGQDWAWSEDLVARLAETRPELYAGWDADTLARTLSGLGIETRQLNRRGPEGRRLNRRGVVAADLPVAALPATRSTGDST